MGTDKAWLEIGGQPLITHVIAALRPVTTSVAIIANDHRYKSLGLPVFPDLNQGVGPLEAVRTALANSRSPHSVLVGCDLPFVTSELFACLLGYIGNNHALVPKSANGKLQPLCAIYCKQVLPIVNEIIDGGGRQVRLLFDRVRTRVVEFTEISHLWNSELFFENINTRADYDRAEQRARLWKTT